MAAAIISLIYNIPAAGITLAANAQLPFEDMASRNWFVIASRLAWTATPGLFSPMSRYFTSNE